MRAEEVAEIEGNISIGPLCFVLSPPLSLSFLISARSFPVFPVLRMHINTSLPSLRLLTVFSIDLQRESLVGCVAL